MDNFGEKVTFIWSVADLLRDAFKRSKYPDVILPFTVLRRIDCVLEPTKKAVLTTHGKLKGKLENLAPQLRKASGFCVLQHLAVHLRVALRRCQAPRRQPEELHQLVLREHAGGHRAVRLPQHHRQARTIPGCCSWSRSGSRTSTCTRTRCRTWRWATSSRN